jgi:rod shape-determining protein MreB and related proteins
MLKELIAKYFDNILYIQLWAEKLKVVDVNSGVEFCQPPYIALEKNNKGKFIVKAVGTDAKNLVSTATIEVTNPFSHPRLLVADFQKAEKILMHAVRKVCAKKLFSPSPRVVIHPMEKLEGGLTDIELRVFRELCIGAGAREVVVYIGPSLSLQSFDYEAIKHHGL